MSETIREAVYKVIRLVATPLRFFAVALLLLAAMIVMLAWKSALPAEMTVNLIYMSLGMFMLLLLVVCVLVIFFPKKLTFDQEAHLTVLREKLGDNEFTMSYFSGTLPAVEPQAHLMDQKGGN